MHSLPGEFPESKRGSSLFKSLPDYFNLKATLRRVKVRADLQAAAPAGNHCWIYSAPNEIGFSTGNFL
jgi:hypothetical protein